MDKSRRDFLKIATAAGGLGLLSSALPVTALAKNSVKKHDLTPLRHAWRQSGLVSPMSWLHQEGLIKNPERVGEKSRYDFLNGRTLDVDGLQLSISESAFLLVHTGADK